MASEYDSGLKFRSTELIQRFLNSASCSAWLQPDSELGELVLKFKDEEVVPYSLLKNVWSQAPAEDRPGFKALLTGAEFAFESPKPREKSKELQERLKELQELADQRAYKELVKDVVKDESDNIPFSSYKDQLGFGLHVIVTMFTGFLVGYAFFRSQFQQTPVLHVVGGLVGLFAGMILETTLFIIRDYQHQNASKFRRRTKPRAQKPPFRSSKIETKKRQ